MNNNNVETKNSPPQTNEYKIKLGKKCFFFFFFGFGGV